MNSEFDKFESYTTKADASLMMQTQISADESMKLIRMRYGPFEQDEINFFKRRLSEGGEVKINSLQKMLVFDLFYRYFGDTMVPNCINLDDYITLILAARRVLEENGMYLLAAIVSSKVIRLATRKSVNKKEMTKLENSELYESIKNKYRNEKIEKQKELFDKIAVGMEIDGVVKNVTSFGAFIDLGGADGLLHISEMSWGRIDDPKSVLKVGDTVKSFIKEINGEKIALSLKFDDQNPWVVAADKYAVGNVVTGKVARMTAFGAFVELEPGVDALLHVSQISNEHVEKPEDVFKIGDEVTAKVVDIKIDEKKISLSRKALMNPEVSEEAENVEEVEETASEE